MNSHKIINNVFLFCDYHSVTTKCLQSHIFAFVIIGAACDIIKPYTLLCVRLPYIWPIGTKLFLTSQIYQKQLKTKVQHNKITISTRSFCRPNKIGPGIKMCYIPFFYNSLALVSGALQLAYFYKYIQAIFYFRTSLWVYISLAFIDWILWYNYILLTRRGL